jgi:hypothetical protein
LKSGKEGEQNALRGGREGGREGGDWRGEVKAGSGV